jgi:hypothetical protein
MLNRPHFPRKNIVITCNLFNGSSFHVTINYHLTAPKVSTFSHTVNFIALEKYPPS